MKTMLIRIVRLIPNALMLFAVLIAAVLTVPRLLGYTPFTVLSGSMEPAYPVGSIVYVRDELPESIRASDVVMFELPNGMPVTHRVVSADSVLRTFVTKGDANPSEDPVPVPFEQVTGKAGVCLPLLGYAALFMQTPSGLICVAFVMLILLLAPKAIAMAMQAEGGRTPKAD